MTTTAQHMAARANSELIERLVAMAEMNHVPNAAAWVQFNLGILISESLTEGGDTIASLLDYALAEYQKAFSALPPLPGSNPSIVTDAFLQMAVDRVLTPDTPPSP